MRLTNHILLILGLLLLFACIKPYDPVIDSDMENKYVVTGCVTSVEGWQEVEVSMSSPIESPTYIPVEGCFVMIEDDKGNQFPLHQYMPGHYQVWMRQIDLTPGTSYKVKVVTRNNEVLESEFDQMSPGPPIDSIYYHIEDKPTSNPDIYNRVMQVYVDLNAIGDYSQNYQWEIVETWEYEAAHPLEYYFDGTHHEVIPPDYTNKVCWKTSLVKNVFTVSTKSLSQNIYNQYPLQTLDGHTSRLGIGYSMLVRQFALSEGAFNYWEALRINSNEQGGLYEKQPFAIKGNVLNVSNPEKDVLGYFYAASESSRRYFYQDIEGIVLDYSNECYESGLGKFGFREYFPREYPIYYYFNETGMLRILNVYCVDCRCQGGTIIKPDFWPN